MIKYIRIIIVVFALGLGFSGANVAYGFNTTGDEYQPGEGATYEPAVVKLKDEAQLDELKNEGAVILRRRGDIVLCYIPKPETPYQLRGRGKDRVLPPRRNVPSLDYARPMFDAEKIITGDGLPQKYTGSGIVVGICDIGFDPTHPAFFDRDGNTRIKKLTQYVEDKGWRLEMNTPEQYREWRTDNDSETHATHVCNILAGGYDAGGYQGIASGSDIVVSTSQLSDVGLLCGAEDILDYAKSVGKPCVINMSMGNYVGPHDGTSLFCQYLDMLGKEAIIVMSAGNEGRRSNTLCVDIDGSTNKEVGFRLANYKYTNFEMYGYTDIWSTTDKSLQVQFVIYNEGNGQIEYVAPGVTLGNGEWFAVDCRDPESEYYDAKAASYYKGWLTAEASIWENGHMNVMLQYDMKTEPVSPSGPWARYNIGIILKGADGEPLPVGDRIDVYADGQWTFLKTLKGYSQQKPSADMSISDLATAQNIISVGMYDSRDETPSLENGIQKSTNAAGIVNPNSSYGTLADGRVLPLTVAPGADIVSACSRPYIDANPDMYGWMVAKGNYNGEEYFWKLDCGTSMSAPYVAGFLSCWLEAYPVLQIDDLKRIIAQTNRHDYPDAENPRHGCGWFDPLAGLKAVLYEKSVVVDRIDDSSNLFDFRCVGDKIHVSSEMPVAVSIYGVDGSCLRSFTVCSGDVISLDDFGSGTYIVSGVSGLTRVSRKIVR